MTSYDVKVLVTVYGKERDPNGGKVVYEPKEERQGRVVITLRVFLGRFISSSTYRFLYDLHRGSRLLGSRTSKVRRLWD